MGRILGTSFFDLLKKADKWLSFTVSKSGNLKLIWTEFQYARIYIEMINISKGTEQTLNVGMLCVYDWWGGWFIAVLGDES